MRPAEETGPVVVTPLAYAGAGGGGVGDEAAPWAVVRRVASVLGLVVGVGQVAEIVTGRMWGEMVMRVAFGFGFRPSSASFLYGMRTGLRLVGPALGVVLIAASARCLWRPGRWAPRVAVWTIVATWAPNLLGWVLWVLVYAFIERRPVTRWYADLGPAGLYFVYNALREAAMPAAVAYLLVLWGRRARGGAA